MFRRFLALFGVSDVPTAADMHNEVVSNVEAVKAMATRTLEKYSEEQIAAEQAIDALLHEVTRHKQRIVQAGSQATVIQDIRSAISSVATALDNAVEDVQDGWDNLIDRLDGQE